IVAVGCAAISFGVLLLPFDPLNDRKTQMFLAGLAFSVALAIPGPLARRNLRQAIISAVLLMICWTTSWNVSHGRWNRNYLIEALIAHTPLVLSAGVI